MLGWGVRTRSILAVGLASSFALFAFLAIPALADAPSVTYIVTFDEPPTADQIDALSAVSLAVHGFTNLPSAVVVATPADLSLIGGLPGVRAVYPNRSLVKMLRQSTRTIHADQVWSAGITGAGVGVAVIDTGIDGTRADVCAAEAFCNGTPVRTVQNVKFLGRQDVAVDPVVTLEDQINTDTSSGHGTHVAGIVGSAGVSSSVEVGKYRGVAWGSRLIGLGTGELLEATNVLAAFDWAIEHRNDPAYNIKVLNNSWGPGAGTPFDPNDPVQRAITAAYDAGLSVVFGAGNAGPTTDSMNAFSVNPKAISVAAGAKDGHVAFFSSRGVPGSPFWHPTVTAPGYNIASVRASTGFYGDVADATAPNPDMVDPADAPYYASASGTSMSSPHVAGIIALMQQASFSGRGVYLTPDQVKSVLQNTAVSQDSARGPGGLPNYQHYTMGAGYADAAAAVEAARTGTHMESYSSGVAYDVKTFNGAVGPAGFVATQSFSSEIAVQAGAISLDVMSEWGVQANDVDLDLFDPTGAMVRSTFLQCAPAAEPNGYSSFCTQIPNERITIPAPSAGTWRVVVHGSFSAVDTARGTWSVAYPSGTTIAGSSPASVTISPVTSTSVVGQAVSFVANATDAAGNPIPNAPVTWTSSGVGSVRSAESYTHLNGSATGWATSESPGTQTFTATIGGLSASATITWLGVTPPEVMPEPQNSPGRASGGGWINNPGKQTFGFWGEFRTGGSPSGELSFDDKQGTKVKQLTVDRFTRNGNSATMTGTATVNGVSGYRFTVDVTDNGEPGRNDTFHLELTKTADPLWTYDTSGTLVGGNLQVKA